MADSDLFILLLILWLNGYLGLTHQNLPLLCTWLNIQKPAIAKYAYSAYEHRLYCMGRVFWASRIHFHSMYAGKDSLHFLFKKGIKCIISFIFKWFHNVPYHLSTLLSGRRRTARYP